MNTMPPDTVDAQSLIDIDLACVACGYNLRTQPRDGRCPECATPVADSLLSADPAWCRSTAWGLHFLSWVMAFSLLPLVHRWLFPVIVQNVSINVVFRIGSVNTGVYHATNLALIGGLWWIARPDQLSPRRDRKLRLAIRAVSLVYCVCSLPATVVFIWILLVNGWDYNPNPVPTPYNITWSSQIALWPRMICWTALFCMLLTLVWRWLSQTHHPRIDRWLLTIYRVLIGITILAFVKFVIILRFESIFGLRSPINGRNEQILGWIYFIESLLRLVLLVSLFFATRLAAASILQFPTNHDDNHSESYRTTNN